MSLARKGATLAALAASLLAAGSATAQQTTPAAPAPATAKSSAAKPAAPTAAHHAQSMRRSKEASLLAEAKISKDSARKVALAQVPNGKVQSSELEREHGKVIYSFDIKVAGKSGIEEVNVDAATGAVVAREHEGAKAERAEQAQEAKEQSAAKKPAHHTAAHTAAHAAHDSTASHP